MNTPESAQPREVQLGHLFVRLADNLVQDFDIVDLLHDLVTRSVELVDAAAAGLMLTDPQGRLRVMAASSEQARLLELLELQNEQGPGLECFRSGQIVSESSPAEQATRWPTIAPALRALDFEGVHAVPLRLRDEALGVLNIFGLHDAAMSAADLEILQALADVATISLLQHRALEARERLVGQLQTALNSRIVIEQAKGVIAQYASLNMDEAFGRLRSYARETRRSLSDVASALASGRLDPDRIAPWSDQAGSDQAGSDQAGSDQPGSDRRDG